jgi:hypothetical protein
MEDILGPILRTGVTLRLLDGRLQCHGPSGDLPAELVTHIGTHESDLIEYLHGMDGYSIGPTPQLTAGSLDGRFKMSFLQEMAVVLYGAPSVRTFNLVSAMQLTGSLQPDVLQDCILDLVRRHAILRASVTSDDQGNRWLFIRDKMDVKLHYLNIAKGSTHSVANDFGTELFDLENGPLFRIGLGDLGGNQHLLILVLHHAIADGWSLALAWSEMLRRYNSSIIADRLLPPSAPLLVQFTDVMTYRHAWLNSEPAHIARAYWKKRLLGSSDPFALPYDRTTRIPDTSPAPVSGLIYKEHCRQLAALCKQERLSISTLTLAAFAIVLTCWSKRSDIVTWVTHAGRRRREVLPVMGCFFDTWLLRVAISQDMNLLDAIHAVNKAVISALPTLDLPGSQMLRQFTAVRGPDLKRIIMFNFMPSAAESVEQHSPESSDAGMANGVVRGKPHEIAPAGHFESGAIMAIYLTVLGSDDSIRWFFRHDPGCFEDESIQRVSLAFMEVLRLACERPTAPVSELTFSSH